MFWEYASEDVNQLYIISGYATPNMTSWLIENIKPYLKNRLQISIIVGMTPVDGLSVTVHNGFIEMINGVLPDHIESLLISYVFERPPVHSSIYIWAKDDVPLFAFAGSAEFTQHSLCTDIKEVMVPCDAFKALSYYNMLIPHCIYCNHAEVEEYVLLRAEHILFDTDSNVKNEVNQNIPKVTLSFLTTRGETGEKSGLNWGQRLGRNPNQAYIPLPSRIARSGFFPLHGRHFTVVTDDGCTLILRVEQDNDKAITTPLDNSRIGEYFRNRLGLSNGKYVWKKDLVSYGRTNVDFYKLDDDQFYMDFSV